MPRRKEAKDAGVEVLSLKCHVGMDRLESYEKMSLEGKALREREIYDTRN